MLMKPFILIYHFVRFLLSIPRRIISGIGNALLGAKDKKELEDTKRNETIHHPAAMVGNQSSMELNPMEEDNLKGIGKKTVKPATKDVLFTFRYQVQTENGKKITGFFDAESINNCREFLEAEGYKVISVEPRKSYDIELFGSTKIKTGDLAFALTQLSTYIKAGIPLVDAVRILAKQSSKPAQRRAYEKLVYDLLKGENLSDAMIKQEQVFPKLLINMIKSAEMTGDLSSILDDMSDYYESMERTRKAMMSAMTYPVIVLLLAFGVLTFMLMFIVPKFVEMFESQGAALPMITQIVINLSTFIQVNWLYLAIAIIMAIIGYHFAFKNVKSFRVFMQTIYMKTPVFGKIIIYNEVYNFTKTFASLINHGVFITDSMEILSKISENEVYRRIIAKTLSNLAKGDSISTSFRGEWAFPDVAYQMLLTGENTGQLGVMMEKVSDHYQSMHKSLIDQLKSLIEPLMIAGLAVIVGVILLSIVVPMFDIYGKIQ